MDDVVAGPPGAASLTTEQAERLVLELIGDHAESLLRLARRYSLCDDDAYDAYQRGLEILLRHAARLDRARAGAWLHTVVKHYIGTSTDAALGPRFRDWDAWRGAEGDAKTHQSARL